MKSEFDFITDLRQSFNLRRIGDDCAVLPKDEQTDLVITADLLVEDIDFRLDWSLPGFIGHKALAVSFSDVCAMGAKPVWSMVSIGIPEKIWKTDFVENFYEGYFGFAKKFNVELIGGDVSRTPDKIVIDSIVGGVCKKGRAVLRSGARVGDSIYVTGDLGGTAAGLRLLENGVRFNDSAETWKKELLLKQLTPLAKIWSNHPEQIYRIANSLIDLSDALSSDLRHVCRESGVGARIYAEQIPFDRNLESVAETFDEKLDLALNGGEDFELLFTANPSNSKNILEEISGTGNVKISWIGEITETTEKIELISKIGARILDPKGFQHF